MGLTGCTKLFICSTHVGLPVKHIKPVIFRACFHGLGYVDQTRNSTLTHKENLLGRDQREREVSFRKWGWGFPKE